MFSSKYEYTFGVHNLFMYSSKYEMILPRTILIYKKIVCYNIKICFLDSIGVLGRSPCLSPKVLTDTTRLTSFVLPDNVNEQCDRAIEDDWYTFNDREHRTNQVTVEMAMFCPLIFSYSSTKPIWLNGKYD
jgi:hypothetical protein